MTQVCSIRRVQGVNLSGFLDTLHMVSYHLPIHFFALNETDKEIVEGILMNTSFLIATWYKNANKSLNYGPIILKI